MKITNNIIELIGSTPLVKLSRLTEGLEVQIAVKLEFFNPGGSVKDRTVRFVIEAAEKTGRINKNTVIAETTSGNTSIDLVVMHAARGYKLTITIPESMSRERKILLRASDIELILTPAAEDMAGAIAKAQSLMDEHPGTYFIPRQFDNEANSEVHRETTVEEVRRDTDGKVDIFVVGVSTDDVIIGVGEVLKKYKPEAQIVAVESEAFPVLSGGERDPHPIQGLGTDFIPSVLDTTVYDSISKAPNEAALETAHAMAEEEGTSVGTSSGATVRSALQLAKKLENEGKLIAILLSSYDERCLSAPLFANLA